NMGLNLTENIDSKDESDNLNSISNIEDIEDLDDTVSNTQALIVNKASIIKSDNELTSYLQEVRKYPSLTPEEEYALAVDWADNKNINSAHKLVTSHLKLVTKIAMNFRGY